MEPVFVDKSSNSTSPQQSTHLRTGSSSSNNSNPTTATSTNLRWVPTKEQKEILEELYSNGLRTPSAQQIEDITRKLKAYGHIEGKNVFYWFQNHKARLRLKQKQQQQQLMSIHPAAAASGFNLHKGNNGITSPYHHHHLRLPVHQSMPPSPPPHLVHPKIYTPNGYYMGHTPAAIPQHDHHQQQHQMGRSYYNIHHHQQHQQSPFLYNAHTYYTAGLSTTDVNSSTKITHLRKKRNHNNNNNNLNIENKTLDLFPLHPTAEGRCGAGGNSITPTTTTSSDSDHHHHQVNCYDQRFL